MKYTIEIDGQTVVYKAESDDGVDDHRKHIAGWEEFIDKFKRLSGWNCRCSVQPKFTIEDLRNGECAVKNDGTLEELREVCEKAFSNNPLDILGRWKYYMLNEDAESLLRWNCDSETKLPTQSVKDFLSFSPKRGDKVLVRDMDTFGWEPIILLSEIKGAEYPFIGVSRGCEDDFYAGKKFATEKWKQMKPLEQPKKVIVILNKANYLNKEGRLVEARVATIDGEEYYIANEEDLPGRELR